MEKYEVLVSAEFGEKYKKLSKDVRDAIDKILEKFES